MTKVFVRGEIIVASFSFRWRWGRPEACSLDEGESKTWKRKERGENLDLEPGAERGKGKG